MSVSGGDEIPSLFLSHSVYWIGIITVISVGVFFAVLKYTFDTYSITIARQKYSKSSAIRKHYMELFSTRDSLMFHVSWAKSRGDTDQAAVLMQELDKIDRVSNYLVLRINIHFIETTFIII